MISFLNGNLLKKELCCKFMLKHKLCINSKVLVVAIYNTIYIPSPKNRSSGICQIRIPERFQFLLHLKKR